MGTSLVTAPTEEPFTLGYAKEQLKVADDETDQNAMIIGLLLSARKYIEKITNNALVTQTWKYSRDEFIAEIELPKPPLISIDSVNYVDIDGVAQVLDPSFYQYDVENKPGRLCPAYGEVWPQTRRQLNAVQITFTCGFGAAVDVPEEMKLAMNLYIGHFFRNTEETTAVKQYPLKIGIKNLVSEYIIIRPST